MEGVSGGRCTGRVLGGDDGIVVVVTVGLSTSPITQIPGNITVDNSQNINFKKWQKNNLKIYLKSFLFC